MPSRRSWNIRANASPSAFSGPGHCSHAVIRTQPSSHTDGSPRCANHATSASSRSNSPNAKAATRRSRRVLPTVHTRNHGAPGLASKRPESQPSSRSLIAAQDATTAPPAPPSGKDHDLGGSGTGAVSADHGSFPVPARQTVHAVLPHTAYRRSSPAVFGLPAPVPEGPGRDDGSMKASQAQVVWG
jgi:hypothetical protein